MTRQQTDELRAQLQSLRDDWRDADRYSSRENTIAAANNGLLVADVMITCAETLDKILTEVIRLGPPLTRDEWFAKFSKESET